MTIVETAKFNIHYSKTKPLNLKHLEETFTPILVDAEYGYNPFCISQLQNYNPVYSTFFAMNSKNYDAISFNSKYHMKDLSTVVDAETKNVVEKPVFIKFSPLLDPLRYMIGKYDLNDTKTKTLPDLSLTNCLPKLADKNNTSYVDNMFSFLTSKLLHHHGVINCVDYYGSFLGIQRQFKMNISDDLEYLNSSDFFNENVGKLFKVNNSIQDEFLNFGTRSNKIKVNISETNHDNLCAVEIEDVLHDNNTNIENLNTLELEELVYENVKENDKELTHSSSSSESDDSEEDEDDEMSEHSLKEEEGEEDWETEDEEEEEEESCFEEPTVNAYIDNFPVQMICLEKCDGTLDELFIEKKINPENASAILMQIIITLIIFQKTFHFTHNDLHTNNVMYVNTDIEFIHYKYKNKTYKVPTHGKIFKIIDFGRGIYKYQGKTFCSDSFATGGDAATQYNFEPFFNENKPRLDPNYSFDLCRLGTSIYDFIIEDESEKEMDEFQKTIYRWCMDDKGKNIMYKKNGEERYPSFKLYKMIARTVHKHLPEDQLKFSYFKQYLIENNDVDSIDIDAMPSY
jgi:hypothetical protein